MPYGSDCSKESHEGERDAEHHKHDAKSHRWSLGIVIQWPLPLRVELRSGAATIQDVLAPFIKLDDSASHDKHHGEQNR
jgi:hypothetical protein